MITDVKEFIEVCDWFVKNGLSLKSSCRVIAEMEIGDSPSLVLLREFRRLEENYEKENGELVAEEYDFWDEEEDLLSEYN